MKTSGLFVMYRAFTVEYLERKDRHVVVTDEHNKLQISVCTHILRTGAQITASSAAQLQPAAQPHSRPQPAHLLCSSSPRAQASRDNFSPPA